MGQKAFFIVCEELSWKQIKKLEDKSPTLIILFFVNKHLIQQKLILYYCFLTTPNMFFP